MPSERDEVKRLQERIRRQRRRGIRAGHDRIRRLLTGIRGQVLAEVAGTEWDRFFLPRLQSALDDAMSEMGRGLAEEVRTGQAENWLVGNQMTLESAGAMGVRVSFPEIPTSLLQTLQAQAAERVTRLRLDAKRQIDRAVAEALLAGRPREDAIQAIGRALEAGSFDASKPQGLFGTVDRRARFIFQHEVGQAFSAAQALRRDQVKRYMPDVKKTWVHDGHPLMPRPEHVALHGVVVDQDDAFPNGLMYPRDPGGPIGETAGCTCDVFLYKEEYGDVEGFIGPATGTEALEEELAAEGVA